MKVRTAFKATLTLIALGIISSASADNVVYLTGSTAFRATTYNALHAAGTVFDGAVTEVTYGGSSSSGANYMVFHGNINGTATYINCAWSGSEAGIASAANVSIQNTDRDGNTIPLAGSPETWLDVTKLTLDGSHNSDTTGLLEASSHGSDLAMADTSQQVSLTPRVLNTSTDLKDYGTVAIVTFTWCKNVNTSPTAEWTALTNITIPQANVLFAQGFQPAAFFTGNSSHTNRNVYLVGRNKGSGTRANELADTGYGTTRAVQQFSIGGGVQPGEAQTTTLLLKYEANNGYESGGGVATALGIDGSCQQNPDPFFPSNPGWFAVAFLGVSDAQTHGLTIANHWLSSDGVFESDGAIEEGQYVLWGHEHLFGKHNISGFQDTAGQKLFAGLQSSLGTAGSVPTAHSPGIALQYMHCDKASDVAYPTRN